jgi:electron transfer flavoprotein alpha/beta subunit
VKLPAVVTVDLRIVAPTSVYSLKTAATFKYNEGVRFAALAAIMAAKKKPLAEVKLADLAGRIGPQGHVPLLPGAAGTQGRHQGERRRRPRDAPEERSKGRSAQPTIGPGSTLARANRRSGHGAPRRETRRWQTFSSWRKPPKAS